MSFHYCCSALLLILLQFHAVLGGGRCTCQCSSSRSANSDGPQEGASDSLADSRIYAGKYTKVGGRPFQVGLSIKGAVCGGSIYNSVTILTAAHCITGATAAQVLVFVGTVKDPEDLVAENANFEKAAQLRAHPSYKSKFAGHDIGLIRLAAPIQFNSIIKPIGVLQPGVDLTGKVGVASGWGVINAANAIGPSLKEAAGTILSRKECQRRIKAGNSVVPSGPNGQPLYKSLCVQARKADGPAGQGSCPGDSGGPLTCEVGGVTKLCGIVAAGVSCGRDIPQIYTEVNDPAIYKWIVDNAWK